MLCMIDEFTGESLAIRVARKLKATDVIDVLVDLFILRGISTHIRFDNIPEFARRQFGNGLLTSELRPPTSNPAVHGSDGYNESFNGKLRDELLNGEIFYTLIEGRIVIEA